MSTASHGVSHLKAKKKKKKLGFCTPEPAGHQLWVCPGATQGLAAPSGSGEAALRQFYKEGHMHESE